MRFDGFCILHAYFNYTGEIEEQDLMAKTLTSKKHAKQMYAQIIGNPKTDYFALIAPVLNYAQRYCFLI